MKRNQTFTIIKTHFNNKIKKRLSSDNQEFNSIDTKVSYLQQQFY